MGGGLIVCLHNSNVLKTEKLAFLKSHLFTNVRFCSLQGDGNGIVFKNMHFETCFKKFVFRRTVNERADCIKSFRFLVENGVV